MEPTLLGHIGEVIRHEMWYIFIQKVTQKLRIRIVRTTVPGQNLFSIAGTWTGSKSWTPRTGLGPTSWPVGLGPCPCPTPNIFIFEPYLVGRTDGKGPTNPPGTGPEVRVSLGFRAGLDCTGKVHRSRGLEEWSNMIGYAMGFSQVQGLQYGQNFSGEGLQAWMAEKKWHGCQHGNTILIGGGGSSLEVEFPGQLQTLKRETWSRENFILRHLCIIFSSLSPIPL